MVTESPFSPRAVLWLNRFMFAAMALVWIPVVLLATVRSRFTVSRSLPLLLISAAGVAYLFTRVRAPSLHRRLGVLANSLVVVYIPIALATSAPGNSPWGVTAILIAVAALFAYPLTVLLRNSSSVSRTEGGRA